MRTNCTPGVPVQNPKKATRPAAAFLCISEDWIGLTPTRRASDRLQRYQNQVKMERKTIRSKIHPKASFFSFSFPFTYFRKSTRSVPLETSGRLVCEELHFDQRARPTKSWARSASCTWMEFFDSGRLCARSSLIRLAQVRPQALGVNSRRSCEQKGLQVHGPDEYLEPKWLRYQSAILSYTLRYVFKGQSHRSWLVFLFWLPALSMNQNSFLTNTQKRCAAQPSMQRKS